MRNFIPEIERLFGMELSPDLIEKVRTASRIELADLSESYRKWEKEYEFEAPDRKQNELRPYFPANHNYVNWAVGGIAIRSSNFRDQNGIWQIVDNLTQRLLYCHSVAIDDPGAYFLDVFRTDTLDQLFERCKQELINYLAFLYHLRPLIDSGVLVLVSKMAYIDARKDQNTSDSKKNKIELLAESNCFDDFVIVAKSYNKNFQDDLLSRQVILNVVHKVIESVSVVNSKINGGVDFYLPFECYREVLSQILQPVELKEVPETPLTHLRELVQVEIPGLMGLDPKDLVSLRINEEIFEDWRKTLRSALERITALPKDRMDRGNEAFRILREEVLNEQKALMLKFNKNKFLKACESGAKTFTVGTLVACSTSLQMEDFFARLKVVGYTSLLYSLWDYLKLESSKSDEKAKFQHTIAICGKT